ncbi:aldose 1-epimerase [Georgenia sp. H159]|uniref:aldose 1-epimerase n=1 Tax=Georgenia sp. H159 TaxID=3076115 RepID=UPI002D767841|nr:aldose 1-epimerase [Georgenia sp. H159]
MERGDLGGEPTVIVRHGGTRLEVALAGATVLRWSTSTPDGGTVELAAGYASAAELERNLSGAFAIMAPFANRLRGGRYTFDGSEYDLRPEMHPQDTEVIHGLVRRARWRLDGVDTSGELAALTLSTTIRPEQHAGYPFALDLEVVFRFGGQRLGAELRARNVGPTDAPVVLGWHPYLTLPGHETVNGLRLTVPARTRVAVDEQLIPLAGEEAYREVDDDGASWDPLDDTRLDTAFLLAQTDGVASTWLRSPMTGRSIEVRQRADQAPVMHVFTADTLPGKERQSIALEPVSAVADAFNREEWDDRVRLAPAAVRELSTEIIHHPNS